MMIIIPRSAGQAVIFHQLYRQSHSFPSGSFPKFNDFEADHVFPAIGRKVMLLNARRIYPQVKEIEMILLALER